MRFNLTLLKKNQGFPDFRDDSDNPLAREILTADLGSMAEVQKRREFFENLSSFATQLGQKSGRSQISIFMATLLPILKIKAIGGVPFVISTLTGVRVSICGCIFLLSFSFFLDVF